MNADALHEVIKICLTEACLVAAPVVLATLLVGTLVTLLQTLTSVQEQTLTFVPKLIGAAVVLWLLAPWMLHKLGLLVTTFFQRAASVG